MSSSDTKDEWLSLTQASELLQVHRSTIRRWADEGKIPCIRTPGGHRRFPRRELEAFWRAQQAARRTRSLSYPSYSAGSEFGFNHEALAREKWHLAFEQADLVMEARMLGQRLLGLMLQYISRVDEDDRFLEEAHSIGTLLGRGGVERGISLRDTVEAFLFCRRTFSELALYGPANFQPADAVEMRRLHGRIDRFMNAALLGAIEAYQAIHDPQRLLDSSSS